MFCIVSSFIHSVHVPSFHVMECWIVWLSVYIISVYIIFKINFSRMFGQTIIWSMKLCHFSGLHRVTRKHWEVFFHWHFSSLGSSLTVCRYPQEILHFLVLKRSSIAQMHKWFPSLYEKQMQYHGWRPLNRSKHLVLLIRVRRLYVCKVKEKTAFEKCVAM